MAAVSAVETNGTMPADLWMTLPVFSSPLCYDPERFKKHTSYHVTFFDPFFFLTIIFILLFFFFKLCRRYAVAFDDSIVFSLILARPLFHYAWKLLSRLPPWMCNIEDRITREALVASHPLADMMGLEQ